MYVARTWKVLPFLSTVNLDTGSWRCYWTVAHCSAQRSRASGMRREAKNSIKDASPLLCTCKLQVAPPLPHVPRTVASTWEENQDKEPIFALATLTRTGCPGLLSGRSVVNCEPQQTNFDMLTSFCSLKLAKKCVCEAGMWSLPRGHELLAVRDFEVGMKAKFTWHASFF